MQGFEEHFATVDTSFAAYLICTNVGQLVRIVPVQDTKYTGNTNYQFHVAPNKGQSISSIRRKQMEYTNRQITVEPVAFHSVRRQLLEQMHAFMRATKKKEQEIYGDNQ